MHTGMLWFDNTPNITLKTRIEKAAEYYRKKYHQQPNLCLIHPSMMGKDQAEAGEEDNNNERDNNRYHIRGIGADEWPGKLLFR